jgi:hypothetical protein
MIRRRQCLFPSCNRPPCRESGDPFGARPAAGGGGDQKYPVGPRSRLPAYIETWDQQLDDFALFPSHVAVVSLGVMGAMLSITGIFGLAAYSVSKWLKELGIRRALGAQRKQVLHADLGRAFKLLACGSATGLVLGILASRVLAHIVYKATPRDPVVLAGVFLATALLGLWATWIPAQRALSLDEDYSCNKTGWVLKALHVQLFSADQQVVVGISPGADV